MGAIIPPPLVHPATSLPLSIPRISHCFSRSVPLTLVTPRFYSIQSGCEVKTAYINNQGCVVEKPYWNSLSMVLISNNNPWIKRLQVALLKELQTSQFSNQTVLLETYFVLEKPVISRFSQASLTTHQRPLMVHQIPPRSGEMSCLKPQIPSWPAGFYPMFSCPDCTTWLH